MFHRNPLRGFGAPGGRNLPIPITLAIGFYNSLHYRASRDCGQKVGWIKMKLGMEVGLGPGHIVFTACTVVQAVVKANSQSNGNGQISTSRSSQTPERISMKHGIYNYVGGYDHTCKSTWRCDNVGCLGEHVTCHMFRFVSIPFFYFILGIAPSLHCLTDFDDLYVI